MTVKNLNLNKQYTKTLLIKDYPTYLYPGWIQEIFYPSLRKPIAPGVHINVGLHIEKSEYQLSKMKMNRLQKSIGAYEETELLSETSREEERGSLEGMLYLRGREDELQELWMTITITSKDKKKHRDAVDKITKRLKFSDTPVSNLPFEQLGGVETTWLGGDSAALKKYYNGRIMDRRAMQAFYPFLSGTITDESGAYIGHRIEDGTDVYLDFTKDPDNQNMMVVGSSDAGKSTFIKGVIISLLLEGFKGYVFDSDGEYRALCKQVDGDYIDYTGDSGKFVDTTHIEPSIRLEVDFDTLDPESKDAVIAADKARYQNAVDSTKAVMSMLSENFSVEKRNAFGYCLVKMWRAAGIERADQSSWDNNNKSLVSLHKLYADLQALSKDMTSIHQKGAEGLVKDLYSYFDEDGIDSNLFKHSDDGSWIKNNKLTVFHVADQVDNQDDNDRQQQLGAVKILMITHMMWQQIKRDRIKKEHFSFEVYDELQRLIKNAYAAKALYRGVTTGRKFNDQVIMGFNDPSILFPGNEGLWNNTKYKVLFSIEKDKIEELSNNASMPEEVKESWLGLRKYEYILRVRSKRGDLYDVLKVELPESEFRRLSKTRGLV